MHRARRAAEDGWRSYWSDAAPAPRLRRYQLVVASRSYRSLAIVFSMCPGYGALPDSHDCSCAAVRVQIDGHRGAAAQLGPDEIPGRLPRWNWKKEPPQRRCQQSRPVRHKMCLTTAVETRNVTGP